MSSAVRLAVHGPHLCAGSSMCCSLSQPLWWPGPCIFFVIGTAITDWHDRASLRCASANCLHSVCVLTQWLAHVILGQCTITINNHMPGGCPVQGQSTISRRICLWQAYITSTWPQDQTGAPASCWLHFVICKHCITYKHMPTAASRRIVSWPVLVFRWYIEYQNQVSLYNAASPCIHPVWMTNSLSDLTIL